MLRRLLAFLQGWVWVEVRSGQAADLLSRLALAGFLVTDVRWERRRAVWRMTRPGARALRAQARGVRVHFGRRGGWPVLWRRSRTRPGLWVGASLAVALFVYATPRVWVVAVADTTPVMAARVVLAAESAGLAPGALRDTLPLERIERSMAKQIPGLAWVGIRVQGALAVVSLHRFYGRAPRAGPVTELVASHAARIVSIHGYLGEVLVSDGQDVPRGTPLMRGWMLATGQQGGAAGEVVGRFTVHATGFQSDVLERRRATGRQVVRSYLVLSGAVWQVAGIGRRLPRYWRARVHSAALSWFGVRLPGAWVRVVYTEEALVRVPLGEGQARSRARAAALAALRRQLEPGAHLRRRRLQCRRVRGGTACTVTASVEQDIAVPAGAVAPAPPSATEP